jgi:hypothetical protein
VKRLIALVVLAACPVATANRIDYQRDADRHRFTLVADEPVEGLNLRFTFDRPITSAAWSDDWPNGILALLGDGLDATAHTYPAVTGRVPLMEVVSTGEFQGAYLDAPWGERLHAEWVDPTGTAHRLEMGATPTVPEGGTWLGLLGCVLWWVGERRTVTRWHC